jgi:DnaJ-class molecular chaperone
LRGKGVPYRAGRVGDHYITVQVDVPGELDDEQKKLLVELVAKLKKKPDRKPG